MQGGIPDDAFSPLVGDDKEACTKWRKVNKAERAANKKKQGWLGFDAPLGWLMNYATGLMSLDQLGDDSISAIHEKEQLYEQVTQSREYLDGKFLADAWCSAFVWKKDSLTEPPITEAAYREIEQNPVAIYHGKPSVSTEIQRLARQYKFLHWHLAFPDVFRYVENVDDAESKLAGWDGGFDCVLGNPPWERIKLQEREWFAKVRPDIANAANAAARRKMIAALSEEDPSLFAAFHDDLRAADGESHLLRNSGRYPLCGKGDINTYAVFAESNRNLVSQTGQFGCILPTGIATDNTTKEFFAALAESNTLVSLYDFENAVGLFEGVGHGRFKFCLLTISGAPRSASAAPDFVFFAHHVSDLNDQDRHFTLTAADIALINPNTRTCPIFRSKRDAEITKAIYRRVPVLIKEGSPEENPWGIRFQRMFDMATDSHLFRTKDQLEAAGYELAGNVFYDGHKSYLPLYEAKMMHQFTHRYGDYAMRPEGSLDSELPRIPSDKLQDPGYTVQPRYWVEEWEVIKATADVPGPLLDAYAAEDRKLIRQVFGLWLASYHLNHQNAEVGEEVLERIYGVMSRSVFQALSDRLLAPLFEQRYPLTDDDLDLIRALGDDEMKLAEAIINRRTPKSLIAFRDICRSTDERTMLSAALPLVAVGHTAPTLFLKGDPALFLANLSSMVFDWAVRQCLGGTHMTYFVFKQSPVLPAADYSAEFAFAIRSYVLELTYTSTHLSPLARALGYHGPPFRWDEARRFTLLCELDAIYFRLYQIPREDVGYMLDSFPIVRRKDEAQFGEYRTKRVILERYDDMADAVRLGLRYKTA
jgi:hypothetical protein